jgi:hypothetical protein
MRCLPAEDNGAFDPSGNKGLEGPLDLSGTHASDAIIGDDYSNLGDDAAHQRISGSGADPSQVFGNSVDSMARAIKAQVPKGPLAYDAALCEKVPGDEPGNLDDREVAALHGAQTSGQVSATSDQHVSSSSSRETEEAGRMVSPSAPADSPDEIKHVVQEETFGIMDG